MSFHTVPNLSLRGNSTSKDKMDAIQPKEKGKCHYCKKPGCYIDECEKRSTKEGCFSLSIEDFTCKYKMGSANLVEYDWAYFAYSYDASQDSQSLNVSENANTWYFDNGASGHGMSKRDCLASLDLHPFAKKYIVPIILLTILVALGELCSQPLKAWIFSFTMSLSCT